MFNAQAYQDYSKVDKLDGVGEVELDRIAVKCRNLTYGVRILLEINMVHSKLIAMKDLYIFKQGFGPDILCIRRCHQDFEASDDESVELDVTNA